MKLNNFIVLLCLLSILFQGITSSKTSRTDARMLTNTFKYALQNEMHNKFAENLNSNEEFMSMVKDPKQADQLIAKITQILARKITKKTVIKKLITSPGNPKAKPVNVEAQVKQVMARVLSNANIAKVLFDIETTQGPLPNSIREKVIKAIVTAFEQIYLHESTPVMSELYTIGTNVHNRQVGFPQQAYKTGNIKNIVKDANQIVQSQGLKLRKNTRRYKNFYQKIKRNTPSINVNRVIRNNLSQGDIGRIQNINHHIAKVQKIERYLKSQFIKFKNSRKNLRKLMKVYLRTKKAEKILKNKKLDKISKSLINSVRLNIHRIKTLKHNIRNIKNPQNRKLAIKLLKKQVRKSQIMLRIVRKINRYIRKNISDQRRYEKYIERYDGVVPEKKQPLHKISPKIAKVAVRNLANNISNTLQEAGCKVPKVQRMLKYIKNISNRIKSNKKVSNQQPRTRGREIVQHGKGVYIIPKRSKIHRNIHRAAKLLKKIVNVKRHLTRRNVIKQSKKIARGILRNTRNKKVAVALAKKFAIKVLRDPKATKSAKKLAIKVYRKVLRAANKTHHAHARHTPRNNKRRVNRFIINMASRILTRAKDATHARLMAQKYTRKILRDRKANRTMKKIAIRIYREVIKALNSRRYKKIVSKNVKQIQKAVLRTKINPHKIRKFAKTIAKSIIRNSKNPVHAKKLALKFALATLKNKKATRAQKKLAIKVYKRISRIARRYHKPGRRVRRKIHKIQRNIPRYNRRRELTKTKAHLIASKIRFEFPPHKNLSQRKIAILSNAISRLILRNFPNHDEAKLLARTYFDIISFEKKATPSFIKMSQNVVRRVYNKNYERGTFNQVRKRMKSPLSKSLIKNLARQIASRGSPAFVKRIARKAILKVLRDPKATDNQKFNALHLYSRIKKMLKKQILRNKTRPQIRTNYLHNLKRTNSPKNASKMLKRAVNIKSYLTKKNVINFSRGIAKTILKSSKNIYQARRVAKKFALKILLNKKSSPSAKAMALKVFMKVNKKFLKNKKKNIQTYNAYRQNRIKRQSRPLSHRNVARRMVRNLQGVIQRNFSAKKISLASKSLANKIFSVAKNPEMAHKLAKKFALKILRNPKASRSIKKLALKVYRRVKRVNSMSRLNNRKSNIVTGINEKSKQKVNDFVGRILRRSKNLRQAVRMARNISTRILNNPRATIKDKKEALHLIRKMKKVVRRYMKKTSGKKALKNIPKRITINKVNSTAEKILGSIKNLAKNHSLIELNNISKKISNTIIKNAGNAKVAKKVVANMIRMVISKRNISVPAKKLLNIIAKEVIKRTLRMKNH